MYKVVYLPTGNTLGDTIYCTGSVYCNTSGVTANSPLSIKPTLFYSVKDARRAINIACKLWNSCYVRIPEDVYTFHQLTGRRIVNNLISPSSFTANLIARCFTLVRAVNYKPNLNAEFNYKSKSLWKFRPKKEVRFYKRSAISNLLSSNLYNSWILRRSRRSLLADKFTFLNSYITYSLYAVLKNMAPGDVDIELLSANRMEKILQGRGNSSFIGPKLFEIIKI